MLIHSIQTNETKIKKIHQSNYICFYPCICFNLTYFPSERDMFVIFKRTNLVFFSKRKLLSVLFFTINKSWRKVYLVQLIMCLWSWWDTCTCVLWKRSKFIVYIDFKRAVSISGQLLVFSAQRHPTVSVSFIVQNVSPINNYKTERPSDVCLDNCPKCLLHCIRHFFWTVFWILI